jgi:outer membrane protein TolC
MKKLFAYFLVLGILGCSTVYQSVVTVTDVRKSVMNDLGLMYRQGLITAEQDAKIAKFDADYLGAAKALQVTLEAYKAGTATDVDVATRMQTVKQAVHELINIVAMHMVTNAQQHQADLTKATKL